MLFYSQTVIYSAMFLLTNIPQPAQVNDAQELPYIYIYYS